MLEPVWTYCHPDLCGRHIMLLNHKIFFFFAKMHLKLSPAKCPLFCSGFNYGRDHPSFTQAISLTWFQSLNPYVFEMFNLEATIETVLSISFSFSNPNLLCFVFPFLVLLTGLSSPVVGIPSSMHPPVSSGMTRLRKCLSNPYLIFPIRQTFIPNQLSFLALNLSISIRANHMTVSVGGPGKKNRQTVRHCRLHV